jgi:phage gp36-like protein
MARAPVPTVAYFRRRAVRPAAFESIPDADVLDCLEDWTDRFATYTGKHTRNVIADWDRSFQLAIISCASFDLMTHRGFKKSDGADSAIKDRYDEALAWGQQVARGEVEPYVNDGADYDDDAAIGSTSEKSDEWTEYAASPCGCR